jgi:hypothetical protein
MHREGKELKGLTPLMAPVPPMLAETFGYYGDARFVAFNWTPDGNDVAYSDGRTQDLGNGEAYLVYFQHPAVNPLLEEYNFGTNETEAEHALIIDREQQEVSIASVREVEAFLLGQWPPQPLRMSQEEHVPKIALYRKHPRNLKEYQRRMKEQFARIKTMRLWLDKQLKNEH